MLQPSWSRRPDISCVSLMACAAAPCRKRAASENRYIK
jgi:hypothetical protein